MSVNTLRYEVDFVVFPAALPEEDEPHRIAIAFEGMEAGNSLTPRTTKRRLAPRWDIAIVRRKSRTSFRRIARRFRS